MSAIGSGGKLRYLLYLELFIVQSEGVEAQDSNIDTIPVQVPSEYDDVASEPWVLLTKVPIDNSNISRKRYSSLLH